ncbi:MAG: HRDC domain-containing protein, partial [Myxococcales bacterium]|nr:HRDC domain-containing protein [Myxococcales bacterium]
MRLKCFSIPALDPDASSEEVSAFLAGRRILAIDRQFVEDGAASYWAICVTYQPGEPGDTAAMARRPKVDYREVLSEEDFAVFAKLRALRKQLSDREKVPAYALFTNEQLATMVRDRVHDTKAL